MTSKIRIADERLADLVTWGSRIDTYVAGMTIEMFLADERTQDAVIRCLEVVGEASAQILRAEPNFEMQHPHLKLAEAYRARNRTAHGYGSVNLVTVWRSATIDCPALVDAARRLCGCGKLMALQRSRNFSGSWPRTPGRVAGTTLVRVYQLTLSGFVGNGCRHYPTCSEYSYEAIARHGLWHGGWLSLFRVARCGPGGTHGVDLVPAILATDQRWFRPWNLWRFGRKHSPSPD